MQVWRRPAGVPAWRRCRSVSDLRLAARAVLPQPVFDFADGGAEDEGTLGRNEAAFWDVELLPRPLRGGARNFGIDLFGHRLGLPPMVGPTGLAGLFWPDGERGAVRAATAAGVGFYLSHGSVCTIEELAGTGTSPRLMQAFLYKDRVVTRTLAERAQAAGYHGLVATVGNQLDGATASLDALPAVAEAVARRIPVMLDGGVRRGAHIEGARPWRHALPGRAALPLGPGGRGRAWRASPTCSTCSGARWTG